jgi:hypothetical protein
MELFNLNEKCMVAVDGRRCKNGGPQRHADAYGRYAICGQHAEMLMKGKPITFITRITAENVATTVNQTELPGISQNVAIAREALGDTPKYMEVEIFYVRGLEPGKVLVLHKEIITTITRWSKGIIMIEAMHHMPNIEGKVTGIMARSGNSKAVWNRKPNGWVERPVPTNLTMVNINNEENK